MLILKDISKAFREKKVLENISLSIKPKEIVGLIGENGSGKSTLLKIINGDTKPDNGFIDSSDEVIGYLPQFPKFENKTIYEFLKTYIIDPLYEYKIEMALSMVGLDNLELKKPCKSLSGGQQTILGFASILCMEPEPTFLLLDEPTNNLDLNKIDWLEKYLNNFEGGILLTSHDRFFLNKTIDKIVELKESKINIFGGNYDFYKHQKQIEFEALSRKYTSQQKEISKVQENISEYKEKGLWGENTFTSRNPYQKKKAAKASRQALVRQKKLEKFLESDDHIEKPLGQKKFDIEISGENPHGKMILKINSISKKYGDNVVLKDVSLEIRGNERIWLIGPNGSGKTTLLKIACGKLNSYTGSVKIGNNIRIGYLAQNTSLDLIKTGIEELLSTGAKQYDCYHMSAQFNLVETDLQKQIKTLSRGQMAKIEFAKLILGNYDILILDEPTNHLEIMIREEIEKALIEYKGAILLASHDRYFVNKIGIDRIFEL